MQSLRLRGRMGRTALRSLACLAIAACGLVSVSNEPPWPSYESLATFDFRPIEATPAIRAMDRTYFYYGAGMGCDFDFRSDPAFAKFEGISGESVGARVGNAAREVIRAEVERLQPGKAGNEEATWRLFAARSETDGKRGYEALKASSCDAMRPQVRDALLEILRFSPQQPVGLGSLTRGIE
jgi:hypothetical protein